MPDGTGIDLFKFPDRAFDVGIAEQHAIVAAGLATENYKYAAIYSTLQRPMIKLFMT